MVLWFNPFVVSNQLVGCGDEPYVTSQRQTHDIAASERARVAAEVSAAATADAAAAAGTPITHAHMVRRCRLTSG